MANVSNAEADADVSNDAEGRMMYLMGSLDRYINRDVSNDVSMLMFLILMEHILGSLKVSLVRFTHKYGAIIKPSSSS